MSVALKKLSTIMAVLLTDVSAHLFAKKETNKRFVAFLGEQGGEGCTSDAFKGAYNAAKSSTPDGDGRVTKTAFVDHFSGSAFGQSVAGEHQAKYADYLGKVFDTFLAMMPGTKKTTLGQHCFRSAAPLAEEFYAKGNDGYCAATPIAPSTCSVDVDGDFNSVKKTASGRVTKADFVDYYMGSEFAKTVAAENKDAYKKYLGMLHDRGYQMMPLGKSGADANTIGGHCFRAVARWTVDFYATGNGGYCTNYS